MKHIFKIIARAFVCMMFVDALIAVDDAVYNDIAYNKMLLTHDYDQLSVHAHLASLYCKVDDVDQARVHLNYIFKDGIPASVELAFDCANMWLSVGDPSKTALILENLLLRCPNNVSIMHNLAYAYRIVGNVFKAIELLESAVKLYPDRDDTQFSLGHTYLAAGDFERGWPQHDTFLQRTHRYSPILKTWIVNKQLAGKRIVIRQEGGLGDMIQWISCAQDLKAMGATVIVCAPKALVPLLSLCPYLDHIINTNETPAQVPHFDAQVTVMSLPCVLELKEDQMARHTPYLRADQDLVDYWKSSLKPGFNVGLCWQSDIGNDVSRFAMARRGIPLVKLARLSGIKGVNFYSLQKKDGLEQLADCPDFLHVFGHNFDESHGSFMDTAAVICSLDLIITVDTAVAHLAGALGRPVWLLLPYQTDWRWILHRTDSPWYPHMKIFKQVQPFDWDGVVASVLGSLQELTIGQ